MNKEELAKMMDGVEYPGWKEIGALKNVAKDNGLIIIYGQSDDLLEFTGATNEEMGAWEGTTVLLTPDLSVFPMEDDDGTDLSSQLKSYVKIVAEWCPKDDAGEIIASWVITTELPHADFNIMEDGELYCKGIVIDIRDIEKMKEQSPESPGRSRDKIPSTHIDTTRELRINQHGIIIIAYLDTKEMLNLYEQLKATLQAMDEI